jgi:hypothetical protein
VGYKLHRRDDANHHLGWPRAKSPRDQRNHSQIRNVRLAVSLPGGRLKSALFPHCHRIDAAFSFLSSMRSRRLLTTKERNVSLINVTKVLFFIRIICCENGLSEM